MSGRALLLVFAFVASFPACGPQAPNTVPVQSKIAHYATEVVTAVGIVQKFVNDNEAALTTPVATQITDANQKLIDGSRKLETALRAYDAATTLDAKNLSRADVEAALAGFNASLGQVFNIKIDSAVGGQVFALYSNVMQIITTIQKEIALGWN